MFVLVAGRRWGKTRAIVSWYLERPYDRFILVADGSRKKHLLNAIGKACNYALDVRRVTDNILTIQDLPGQYGRYRTRVPGPIAIDDAEYLLERLIGSPVELLTINATLIAQPPSTPQDDYVDGDIVPDWDTRPSIQEVRRAIEK